MKPGMIRGIIFIAIGAFLIYWAQTHSPQDFGKVIGNAVSGSYTLSEPWYYSSLALGVLVGVLGVFRVYKTMK